MPIVYIPIAIIKIDIITPVKLIAGHMGFFFIFKNNWLCDDGMGKKIIKSSEI